MAVLNKIRERSVFLIIIIALALFSFVLADLFRNGGFSSGKSQSVIATVNDEEIERESFAGRVEAAQRNANGDVTTTQAVNQVWEASLREALLKEQYEELGIEIGDEQLRSAFERQFSGNPNFTNEAGMFDMNRLREYVSTLKSSSPEAYNQWILMEENVAEQAKSNVYFNMVKAGLGTTEIEAEEAYKMENDEIDLKYVLAPYSSEEVEISKEEIKDYISKREKRFQAEASRDIQYIHFKEEPSTEDENEVKESINSLLSQFKDTENDEVNVFLSQNSEAPYQKRFYFKSALPEANAENIFALEPGETYGPYKENSFWKVAKVLEERQIPDSVKAKDILISFDGSAVGGEFNRTKEEAKTLSDSLLNVLKKDEDKFAELAQEFSDDTSTKEKGGDLDWINYNQVNPDSDVIEFLFSADEGEMEVVETEAGFYILAIDELKNKQRAVHVATLEKQIEPSEKTSNDIFAKTTKFEIAAKDGSFNDIAKEESLEARPVKRIRKMQENIPGIGNQRRLVQWAFDKETSSGDIKRFDVTDGYVVAQVTKINKKGLMSVEEASQEVTPILKRKKQAKLIEEKISGKSMAEIASQYNTTVETANGVSLDNPTLPGATSEPAVVGAAFSMEVGKTSKPISGKKGVYVVELLEKNETAPLNSYRMIAEEQSKKRGSRAQRDLISALKNNAEIEDNRADFY